MQLIAMLVSTLASAAVLKRAVAPGQLVLREDEVDVDLLQTLDYNDLMEVPSGKYRPPFASASFAPDGSRVLTASFKGCQIWKVTGELLHDLDRCKVGEDKWAAFSQDGSRVLTVGNRMVEVWNPTSGKRVCKLKGTGNRLKQYHEHVTSAAISPDGRQVVTMGNLRVREKILSRKRRKAVGFARIWDATACTLVHRLTDGPPEVLRSGGRLALAFSPDGSRVATSWNRGVKIWDVASGALVHGLTSAGRKRGPRASVYVSSVGYSPGGEQVLSAGEGQVRIWNAATGALEQELPDPGATGGWASFSPDGSRAVTGARETEARPDAYLGIHVHHTVREGAVIWDAASFERVREVPGTLRGTPLFSPDGEKVVTCQIGRDQEGRAVVWSATTGEALHTLRGHSSYLLSAAFSPDGSRILTTSADKTAKIWDAMSREEYAAAVHEAAVLPEDLELVVVQFLSGVPET